MGGINGLEEEGGVCLVGMDGVLEIEFCSL